MAIGVANETVFEVSVGPATELTEAILQALDYTVVEDVDSIPEFTGTRGTITRNTVTHGVKQASGAVAQVTPTINVIDNPTDPGQIILNAANISNDTIYIRVTYPNKRIVLFAATIAKAAPSGAFDDFVNMNYQINVSETPILAIGT